jgi:PAP2 superfamily
MSTIRKRDDLKMSFQLKLKALLVAVCVFGCSGQTLASNSSALAKNTQKEALTFTNTQTWLPRYLEWAESTSYAPEVVLPTPPKNTSDITKKELAILHAYQRARTAENIAQIKREVDIYNAFFGKATFAELTSPGKRPSTYILIQDLIEIEPVNVMRQKKIYNRVRPSYLDPTLKPAIDVPQHPAYPSGHATQAQLRALVLSELDPKNRDVYLQAAKRIARNREIAGLHYPSDSKAGFILAGQLFKKLMKNPDFAEHLKEAKTEW